MGYLTVLAKTDLSGDLNYSERNIVEKLFQTYTMRIGRFHETWNGSQASAERVLATGWSSVGVGLPPKKPRDRRTDRKSNNRRNAGPPAPTPPEGDQISLARAGVIFGAGVLATVKPIAMPAEEDVRISSPL